METRVFLATCTTLIAVPVLRLNCFCMTGLVAELIAVTEDDILHLMSQSDPARRPVKDSRQSVQVAFSLTIVHLVELVSNQLTTLKRTDLL